MKPSTPSSTSRILNRQNCLKSKTSDKEDFELILDSKTPKSTKSKKISILGEMGFGTVLPIPKEQVGHFTRVPSIGVSDFWSEHEKEKFLKAKGCWGVYKEQKKKEEFDGITLRRIARHSSLPFVRDLKTEMKVKEKVLKSGKKMKGFASKAVSSSETPESNNKQIKDLNCLVKKCEVLAQDMTDFRNSARKLEDILERRKVSKKKKRISRQDLNEIQNKIYAFN
jgi:hypothetical protein